MKGFKSALKYDACALSPHSAPRPHQVLKLLKSPPISDDRIGSMVPFFHFTLARLYILLCFIFTYPTHHHSSMSSLISVIEDSVWAY